jgi:putative ABC transport system permease protein
MGSRDRFNYFRISERAKAGLPEWREIVGVVADVRSSGLDLAPQPEVFYSYRQYPWYGPTLVMRGDSDPLRLVAAIRREAATLNSRAVVTEVTTMDQIAADSIAEPRIRAQLTGGFSAMALVLGMLGIYGVTSYTVTRRTREIGVRMALGARRADVSWLVIRQALQATAIGLAVGIGGALAAARYISSLLYGVRPADPVTLAGTCVLFAVATLGASLVPAQRAARLDPASALRQG